MSSSDESSEDIQAWAKDKDERAIEYALMSAYRFFVQRDKMDAAVHLRSGLRLSPVTLIVRDGLDAWTRRALAARGETDTDRPTQEDDA